MMKKEYFAFQDCKKIDTPHCHFRNIIFTFTHWQHQHRRNHNCILQVSLVHTSKALKCADKHDVLVSYGPNTAKMNGREREIERERERERVYWK